MTIKAGRANGKKGILSGPSSIEEGPLFLFQSCCPPWKAAFLAAFFYFLRDFTFFKPAYFALFKRFHLFVIALSF
ncbi:hypothetical protein BBD42_16575 [Paenibacillus sp. BIHB 4019]|uniref:Uncharacterized protein n=1 Tax=Paenibacillus sp. BIHB 4019 TaxID=1870819 RepID=A0A1B2DJQ0_9BACL|nr:hypothetical protein BBD42_16575 [Paenibacillus sp. BIHB 4019]